MGSNFYYSKSKVCVYSYKLCNPNDKLIPFIVNDKGNTTHRVGREILPTNEMYRKKILSSINNRFEEQREPTWIETNEFGKKVYGICVYPIEKSSQVKPPIKSLFGHRKEDSITWS